MQKLFRILKFALTGIFAIIIILTSLFSYRDIPLEQLISKYAPSPSSFIDVDDMKVHYRDEGFSRDSIPIVLLHGTGSSLHTFDDWVADLKDAYRLVRLDLPGYGLTGPFPSRDYSIEAYVQFIAHFLDKKGIDKCILGGNSLGGQIAWQFTVAFPENVEKLLLINAAGYPYVSERKPIAFQIAEIPVLNKLLTFVTPKFIARSSVESVYADKSKVTDALVDRYFDLTLRSGNRQAFVDRFGAKRDPQAHLSIPFIEHPTLILWGDQDKLIPLENAFHFQKDLPNDTLIILKNAGHVPMEENPKESLVGLVSFLNAF